jgi:transcriptional regulator GlxA family with amidase domain
MAWMMAHLGEPLSVEALSRALHVSYRTLHRRFLAVTGLAPLATLQALRIERAKELLEATPDDLETITAQVGYEDASSFRRLFLRATSLSPAQYRRRFRAPDHDSTRTADTEKWVR